LIRGGSHVDHQRREGGRYASPAHRQGDRAVPGGSQAL